MKKMSSSWLSALRWAASVLLLVAALQQACLIVVWQQIDTQALLPSLQQKYLPQQAQYLFEQLDLLAQAAGVEAPDVATLQETIVNAADVQLTGKEIALLPTAGTQMKEALLEQLAAQNLEPTEEISAKADLLEQEGNRLEQQAMELPSVEVLRQYLYEVEQRQSIMPTGLIALVLGALGLLGLFLPPLRKKSICLALATATGLSAVLLFVIRGFVQLPLLEGTASEYTLINDALQSWLSPLRPSLVTSAFVMVIFSLLWVVLAVLPNFVAAGKKTE